MPGYRNIPAKDPMEQELRAEWYAAQGADREAIGLKLSAYLWQRSQDIVAEDRKRFPKKKRNLPVPSNLVIGSGRLLP